MTLMPVELLGTWEDIKTHDAELTGRTVRLTILDVMERTPDFSALSPAERTARAMREAEEMERDMPFTKSGDTVAIIRDDRAGAMYGYESADEKKETAKISGENNETPPAATE